MYRNEVLKNPKEGEKGKLQILLEWEACASAVC